MAEEIIMTHDQKSQSQSQYNITAAMGGLTINVDAIDGEKDIHASEGWKEGDPERTGASQLNFAIYPNDPRPEYGNLKTGEMAPPDLIGFVKLKEFEKFYSYIDDKQYEVKKSFFDDGKLWARRWDFFYIYPPVAIQKTAILLLPEDQAKHFLRTINQHLGTSIDLPEQEDAPGLIMYSPTNGTPRPRYIASAADLARATSVKMATPSRSYLPVSERTSHDGYDYHGYDYATEEDFMLFRAQMEALAQTDLQKKEKERLKKEKAIHLQRQAMGRELMRTQRYLGLRKRNVKDAHGGQDLSSDDEEEVSVLDVEKPTPFPQEASVVFVCVDIEAYEFPPNPITEIGIATLDTADIAGIAPGVNGRNWFKKIRARHILIKEFAHLQNKVYVKGHRDGFIFGDTEVIYSSHVKRKVMECFRAPFSKPFSKLDVDADTLIKREHDQLAERNIVFVGHDVKQDIDYLKRLKVDVTEIKSIMDIIDSASVYQALRHSHEKLALGKMLLSLGLVGYNLHNGGNDAVYTVQAMIATALKAEVEKDDLEEQHAEDLENRIKAAVDHQTQLLRKQKEGWDLDEDSDGGDYLDDPFEQFKPKFPSQQRPKPPSQQPPKPTNTAPAKGKWNKGKWIGDQAKNAAKPGPSNAHRPPKQARSDVPDYNTFRPGIQEMRDEDIGRPW